MKKAAYVAFIGRPNVGKSTLLNSILKEHLCITSKKHQTTREKILGIDTYDDFQFVYQDLPGYINPHNELQKKMKEDVENGIKDADIIIFMVEAGEKRESYSELISIVQKHPNVILVVNKIDIQNIDPGWEELADEMGWNIITLCALNGKRVDRLKDILEEKAPEVESFYYDKDYLTDRSERFIVKEYIRETSLEIYRSEIPHELFVDVVNMIEEEDIIKIKAIIYVARNSQKGIVIGQNGKMIKKLGKESRIKLEKFFSKKIFLELNVKIKEKWFNNESILSGMKKDYGVWE